MDTSDTDVVRVDDHSKSRPHEDHERTYSSIRKRHHSHRDTDTHRDRDRRHRHDHDSHRHRHHHRHSDRERREHSHHRHRHHREEDKLHHENRPTDSAPALQRDSWMLAGADEGDLFSSMGQAPKEPQNQKRPNPDELAISARELNPFLTPRDHQAPQEHPQPKCQPSYGGPGYKWRLMKLQRTYEMAEQRGVPVEEVALERYGNMDTFDEARTERQFVEDRDGSVERPSRTPMDSRAGFRRPGVPTPAPYPSSTMQRSNKPALLSSTPKGRSIPRVLPNPPATASASTAPMSVDALNKLEANALRAELMGRPDAVQLRAELEAVRAGQSDTSSERVEAVPVLDGFGRMYDIGSSSDTRESPADPARPAKRSKVEDDGSETLSELVRQERFSAGRADQKDADAILAHQIMADQGFENDLDYMDEEAKRFARKRMRDDALKRQFAVQGMYGILTQISRARSGPWMSVPFAGKMMV